MADISAWFDRRSYHHSSFADLEELARRKRERSLSVTVVLPTLEVAQTIGPVIETILELNERVPLVDQLMVVDARSRDGTTETAARLGAEVYFEDELLPDCGPPIGKGDAMWRALSVARSDLVMYADTDTIDFGPQFIYGVLGPILCDEQVKFVKGGYRRPFRRGAEEVADGGGRVTELTTKPLFNLFYRELAGFVQPLAGEFVAPRSLLASVPFFTGYAVETGLMIDIHRRIGLEAMAQVDLGFRQNRHQALHDLGPMAYSALRAVARRLMDEGRLDLRQNSVAFDSLTQLDSFVQAISLAAGFELRGKVIDIVERPPLDTYVGSVVQTRRHSYSR